MEFEGIPADAKCCLDGVFLGEESSTGKNLRFVDLCWADILSKSYKHVGQDTEVWTKGLLGRLLRKHDGAKSNNYAQVPFWIRRVLFLLADTLLLVRFAMNFRFKEMKELVFVKYLGDVQVYGESARCRGRAVRRFHKMMTKIEAKHYSQGEKRKPRYVIIAHSLGSIMSFDALLYAHAPREVRCGKDADWVFPVTCPMVSPITKKTFFAGWTSSELRKRQTEERCLKERPGHSNTSRNGSLSRKPAGSDVSRAL